MSLSETLIGVNSHAMDTPLNHLIWLNDYKTYGENSYVFQDKDILRELYSSYIAANDLQIYTDAYNYNKSYMSKDDFVKWYKKGCNSKTASDSALKILLYGDFSTWTDSELKLLLDAHYNNECDISEFVNVGEKRSYTLSAMDATGVGESQVEKTVEFAIAGFEHDTLTTPINGHNKAAITLTQVDAFKTLGYMNSTATNVGGWASCARRIWCNDICYNAFPSAIQSLIKPVDKLTSKGNNSSTIDTTSDKVFLFSEFEITGSISNSKAGEGVQYEYFKTSEHRLKGNTCWERSPSSGTNAFCLLYHDGSQSASLSNSNFALSIGISI